MDNLERKPLSKQSSFPMLYKRSSRARHYSSIAYAYSCRVIVNACTTGAPAGRFTYHSGTTMLKLASYMISLPSESIYLQLVAQVPFNGRLVVRGERSQFCDMICGDMIGPQRCCAESGSSHEVLGVPPLVRMLIQLFMTLTNSNLSLTLYYKVHYMEIVPPRACHYVLDTNCTLASVAYTTSDIEGVAVINPFFDRNKFERAESISLIHFDHGPEAPHLSINVLFHDPIILPTKSTQRSFLCTNSYRMAFAHYNTPPFLNTIRGSGVPSKVSAPQGYNATGPQRDAYQIASKAAQPTIHAKQNVIHQQLD